MTSINQIANIDSAIMLDKVTVITQEIADALAYQGDGLVRNNGGELLALTPVVAALRDEAARAGDSSLEAMCEKALGVNDTSNF